MQKVQKRGLVADLWPNIRIIQYSGLFISAYYSDNGTLMKLLRKIYSWLVTIILFGQYMVVVGWAVTKSYDADQRAKHSVTILFFTHTLIKYIYFAMNTEKFHRTLAMWNTPNTHPLFAESNARHKAIIVSRFRKVLTFIVGVTVFTVTAWTMLTFIEDNQYRVPDPETENGTMTVEIPRLLVPSVYPFAHSHGPAHIAVLGVQIYWVFISLLIANILDSLFDSLILVASEQLKHLKEIMGPLIELSAALDTQMPNTEALFRVSSGESKAPLIDENDDYEDANYYKNMRNNAISTMSGFGGGGGGGTGPNGLTKKQEILVRSAIKYWVERHKHIVKYTQEITEMYGVALLFHMLITTFTLTLLAYMATKIRGVNAYAFSTIGYLVYSLGQIYTFCSYGNELIDESSSVMEAAYSCSWYDGSEEAKTFVQIVCQQCQKALSITGAKFFTVSLDLFASVLGAVVTYFMVLIQLN